MNKKEVHRALRHTFLFSFCRQARKGQEQSLLVKAECILIFPRQLVLIKLILPGQFGDTSLVVEFAVFYQFLAVRSGGFPLPNLDDRV